MRWTTIILVVILSCSVVLNILVLSRASWSAGADGRIHDVLGQEGDPHGAADAYHDFCVGSPQWYQVGDSPAVVPAAKPGREIAIPTDPVSKEQEAYMHAYNITIDALFDAYANHKKTQPEHAEVQSEGAPSD